MKKRTFREKISYWFDCMMSKGPISMSILLFAIMAAVVGIIGIIAYFVSQDGGIFYQLWISLMHTLDPGNIAGVSTENLLYLLLMFLATLAGLVLTSVLVGIITAGVESKLKLLRKGTSVVQEDNHTLVIGFDNNVYAILNELIEANANHEKGCIVVLGQIPKEEMEDGITSHITDFKTTRIICRSGNLHEVYALERCSVETCKSVIINVHEDTETVKILLALAAYVKDKKLINPELRFVCTLQDKQYIEAGNIAAEGRAAILFSKDAIARIIANTCRQHGLSQVLAELFNFNRNELYFESVPQLVGKTFREATMSFSNAIVVGLYAKDNPKLNPPIDTIIGENDKIILLELDDGSFIYHPAKTGESAYIRTEEKTYVSASNNLIILGSNDKLPTVLVSYDKFMDKGTRVIIVDDDLTPEFVGTYNNLDITVCPEPVTRDLLCKFIDKDANNILLLNDDSRDPESSDSQTLLRLILLRDIADKAQLKIAVTTEMRSGDNQRLASQARVDDFVIGTNFASLMMAQISENPQLIPLIDELLDERGAELYMNPAANYVATGVPIDSYTLTESAARRGEIYLGYRLNGAVKTNVILNPPKGDAIVFSESDQIVVIANN